LKIFGFIVTKERIIISFVFVIKNRIAVRFLFAVKLEIKRERMYNALRKGRPEMIKRR